MLGYEKPARGRNEAPYPARNTKESQRTNRLEVEEHRRRRREGRATRGKKAPCISTKVKFTLSCWIALYDGITWNTTEHGAGDSHPSNVSPYK